MTSSMKSFSRKAFKTAKAFNIPSIIFKTGLQMKIK